MNDSHVRMFTNNTTEQFDNHNKETEIKSVHLTVTGTAIRVYKK